jgi:hypothetical protein
MAGVVAGAKAEAEAGTLPATAGLVVAEAAGAGAPVRAIVVV